MSMPLPFVRGPYNYDRNKASDESGLKCEDKTRTKQSFKDDADINTIVRRFNLTGQLPTNVRAPEYRDFTDVVDYHTAMNAVAKANEAFDAMPAHVRSRFNNDPGQFVDFCMNADNLDEMKKLGLLAPNAMQDKPASETTPAPTPEKAGTAQETPPNKGGVT